MVTDTENNVRNQLYSNATHRITLQKIM